MERSAWTDERLDDLAERMDAGFARVDNDVRELRAEMRAGFEEVNRRFDEMNARFDGRFDAQGRELRAEIDALRHTILRVGGGMMAGLVGVIAAVLAAGG